jgi:hypothetical protein
MRDTPVAAASVTAAWDPYEVWLNRIKKPRDQRGAPVAAKLPSPDLSETARMRALTLTPNLSG